MRSSTRAAMRALAIATVLATAQPLAARAEVTDTVRHVLMQMFDKPEQPLAVDPVTVEGDIAVAGWAQGEMGGRALLRRKGADWQLILCSGDTLTEAKSLQQFGLTAEQAEGMAADVVTAEARLDPSVVQKFSRFDGVMMMQADGSHPPAGGYGEGHSSGHANHSSN